MRKIRNVIFAVVLSVVFLSGLVLGQTVIQKSSQITYSITAEISVSMMTPLDLGSLSSPSEGSKLFSDAIVVQAFKTGYITLTFSLPQSNLTQLANDFSRFEISIGNGGGEIAWLDFTHTTALYQLATPQNMAYNVRLTYTVKPAVNRPSASTYLLLSVT